MESKGCQKPEEKPGPSGPGVVTELNVPHIKTKLAPMVHRLLPIDFNTMEYFGDISVAPEVEIDDSGLVFTCGSIKLSEIAQHRGWYPGSFLNENNNQEIWSKCYKGHLLNDDSIISRFDEVEKFNFKFMRPTLDNKAFPGKLINWSDYKKWVNEVEKEQNEFAPVTPDTMVAVALPKNIQSEYRCFVVDGQIVTSTQYKFQNRLYENKFVPSEITGFAKQMIDTWQPARAFVIDIAQTDLGCKIVEVGCINSAGFYAADVHKFVEAIESMVFERKNTFELKI